jgi:hypothetical protein
MFPAVRLPETRAFPWTERAWDGEVVPMPTFPLSKRDELVNVEPAHFGMKLVVRADTVDEPRRPRDDVAESVYPFVAFPRRSWPYEGRVERPVPPYATEMVEEADTVPFTAWRGPVREPKVREPRVERPLTLRVPVAVMFPAERLPETRAFPWTERAWDGEVVPIPTFPPVVAKYADPDDVRAVVEA